MRRAGYVADVQDLSLIHILIIEEKTVPPQFASNPLAMALQHLIFKTKRVRHNVAPFEKLELVDGFEPPTY